MAFKKNHKKEIIFIGKKQHVYFSEDCYYLWAVEMYEAM